ncbi:GlxA family transcriptional regulator [Paraburkholderia sp. SARCC-3016]|jgi:transcriptional regulator GlxA family with amidase domain|uniref:GlxA family transcriptional regulator n=1 Tax=Paraburkholderia sp. SARCC-3016 TaxID=3058611 RepID=UPI0028082480|nr:GlxA family transcriptional regulator [Paraburkholderia sp. SARCC-3016]MDQ7982124.1 GlxA family transcriptional regulator [Paraburkholderia sp. SARCC-3016]
MHKIGLVVLPDFYLMGFAAITAFELANLVIGETAYDVTVLSEAGGMVTSSAGIRVESQPIGEDIFDTVMFASGAATDRTSHVVEEFVRRSLRTSRRIAAPCTGAFVLAQAGVLDGRRATTHWRFARDLQLRFPRVDVAEDRIFIVDGSMWTSAGMTATIDMALAMIENDFGREVARKVARNLVVYHRRAGGHSQFSAMLELEPKSDRIQKVIDYASANLRKGLSVEELASIATLSPRQFSRAFNEETGYTPAKAVELLRVEAARLMIERGRYSMDAIAEQVGFLSRDRMRSAFLRVLGQTPQDIRRSARGSRTSQAEPAQQALMGPLCLPARACPESAG